ncbi:MAG: phosphoglucosamine mutase [Candidatus Puniceispirillaceae bacterium]
MAGIFGTDGVRARINTGAMRAESVVRLALAAGRWFVDNQDKQDAPLVVIGKDTRLSGYMLESALVAGFASIGMECRLLGPIPTATISVMTQTLGAHLGVMISASHNPHHDNGIKLFGPDGKKLADHIEEEISALMQGSIALAEAEEMGRVRRILNAHEYYIDYACNTINGHVGEADKPFAGLKIVVDCAHGAAYVTAPLTLTTLGAEIIPLFCEPDGLNINDDCGAVHPQKMAEAVIAHGADLGISLDGDADRVIIADETGTIHDGDHVLGAIATKMKEEGTLRGTVVGTLMTNLGLEQYLASQNIPFARAKVGDRYIMQMLQGKSQNSDVTGNLGGEGSGHILMPDIIASGDGLIAALQLISAKIKQQKPMSDVLNLYESVPMALVNLPDMNKAVLQDEAMLALSTSLQDELDGMGRILLRPSGTEPLIRVMVEAKDKAKLDDVMARLIDGLKSANARLDNDISAS